MKWWPGALARTANFGVVYARLLLHGKDYGVHNFMVQLRDLETHDAMPGVTLGDIGPKIGFNNVDNGYCKFNRVRIPRHNMGMRFATVTREGKYVKNSGVPQEVLYFTMLQTRMVFIRSAGINLAKACTITIRYSAVRQQGYDANNPKSKEELSVLDYQTQQYRLFPLLAAAYAIACGGHGYLLSSGKSTPLLKKLIFHQNAHTTFVCLTGLPVGFRVYEATPKNDVQELIFCLVLHSDSAGRRRTNCYHGRGQSGAFCAGLCC
ncbi:unnamed protein product [Phytophthora lilii]|uniref:Unnamed protein product n=1 Tax=Phytophthora lilii TaxID=2077276 RepID=A0A9W6X256_9STRA|nr:unnamed protein product [Phytophthora lilii]